MYYKIFIYRVFKDVTVCSWSSILLVLLRSVHNAFQNYLTEGQKKEKFSPQSQSPLVNVCSQELLPQLYPKFRTYILTEPKPEGMGSINVTSDRVKGGRSNHCFSPCKKPDTFQLLCNNTM